MKLFEDFRSIGSKSQYAMIILGGVVLAITGALNPNIITLLVMLSVLLIFSYSNPIFGIAFNLNGYPILTQMYSFAEVESGILFAMRMVLIVSLIRMYQMNQIKFEFGKYRLPILLTICTGLIMGFGVLYSDSAMYGLSKTGRFFSFNAFIFIAILAISWRDKLIHTFFQYIGLIAAFIGWLSTIYILYNGINLDERTAVFGNVNFIWLSRAQGIGFVAIYILLRIQKEWSPLRLLLLISLPAIFFGMLITVSRSPMLATLISLIAFEIFSKRRTLVQIFALGISQFVILILLLFYLVQSYGGSRFFVDPTSAMEDASTLHRIISWVTSVEHIIESPVFGIGTGGFYPIAQELFPWLGDFVFRYPHNLFLEIQLENGIMATLCFLAFLYIILFHSGKLNRVPNLPLQASLFSLFAYYFLNAQISGDITMNEGLWFLSAMFIKSEYTTSSD